MFIWDIKAVLREDKENKFEILSRALCPFPSGIELDMLLHAAETSPYGITIPVVPIAVGIPPTLVPIG